MSQNTQTFILVGKFDDQVTPALKKLNKTFGALEKSINRGFNRNFKELRTDLKDFSKYAERLGQVFEKRTARGVGRVTKGLEDAARAAGKTRDVVSQIGEGVKGFDHLAESMAGVGRAAGRAADEVEGIGVAAGRANKQADELMTTLLKAEGLSRFGDAMSQGFNRGMGAMIGTARKGFGIVAKSYRDAMQDEMDDIKAQTSVMGAFTRAGYKGSAEGGGLTFGEAGKFYKKFDMQIADLIRTSSAPTGKVIELQRLTMDTLGPLLLAAEGVPKGMDVKDIKPETIAKTATAYGGMLEQIALLSQGTGSATFRVAQGVEGLIKYGKIDTTMDFFTDNVLLMQALQDAGFAGGRGGGGLKATTLKTEAERLVALQKAMKVAMAPEGIAAMSTSMLGSLQALGDTISNPQVGLFGMAATFTEKEQKVVNSQVKRLFDGQINKYKTELKLLNEEKTLTKKQELRKLQLEKDIDKTQKRLDELIKVGDEKVTTPFKAFSLVFGGVIRNFTEVLNTIGPIWNRFAVVGLEWTYKFLEPLSIALENISSDLRGGMPLAEGVGRIFGEIYKFLGSAMADLAKALTDPTGAMGKIENQFVQGFMSAFKDPAEFEKIKKGFADGMWALFNKFLELLGKVLLSNELRPLVISGLALAFGPPFVSAVIAGATPLLISAIGKIMMGLVGKAGAAKAAGGAAAGVSSALDIASMGAGFLPGGRRSARARALNIARLRKQRQIGVQAKGVFQQQYTNPIGPVPAGFQRPGGRSIMPSNLTKMGKAMNGIQKFGLAASKVAKGIPGLSVAIGVFDIAARKLAGQGTGEAVGGGVGAGVGGTVGAVLGSALGPAGTVAGGILGSFIGDWLGANIGKAIDNAGPMLNSAWESVKSFFTGIGAQLGKAWDGFVQWVKGIPEALGSALGATVSFLKTSWEGLVQWVKDIPNNLGYALGYAVGLLENAWNALVAWWNGIPGWWDRTLTAVRGALQAGWNMVVSWWNGIPGWWSNVVSTVLGALQAGWNQVSSWWNQLGTWWNGVVNTAVGALAEGAMRFGRLVKDIITGKIDWAGMAVALGSAIKGMVTNAVNWLKGKWHDFTSGFNAGRDAAKNPPPKAGAQAFGSDRPFWGTLGEAINYENKHKPPGSDLVIANSSETIIPAAGGLGQDGLIKSIWGAAQETSRTFADGFNSLINMLKVNQSRTEQVTKTSSAATQAAIRQSTMASMRGDQQILAAIKAASAAGGFGVGLGGAKGSLGAAEALAQSMGLQMTSGFRPGDPGYHGANRARDFSNSTGPTPQMMKYAQTMVAKYGTSLTELIYTPLGYSIKNGKKVPPIAAGSHYNHVHVAFANGLKMPTLFTKAAEAAKYEEMVAPHGAKVATVTANSSEASPQWNWKEVMALIPSMSPDSAQWNWEEIMAPIPSMTPDSAQWNWKEVITPIPSMSPDSAQWNWEEIMAPIPSMSPDSAQWNWEKIMAPAESLLSPVTPAPSMSPDSGTINLTQNVSIDGAGDPRAVAEAVWQYTAKVVQQQTHNNFG